MSRTNNRPRRSSHLHIPGAFDLFGPSKRLVLDNIWIFGPLYAVPFIFWLHSWIWSPIPGQHVRFWQHSDLFSAGLSGSPAPAYPFYLLVGFNLLWLILALFIGGVIQIMTNAAQLDAVEHRTLDFQDLWQVVRKQGWPLFKLYVAMTAIIIGGLILLIVPGLIFIRRYMLAPYVMLERNTDVSESLKRSAELSGANPGAVWGIMGVMLLISLAGAVPYIGGLVSFVLGCLYSLAPVMRYQQLKRLR
ncbi:MAG TPA: hypothetical protein VFJ84_02955 [Candidatus Saccharimonadales bacterium]|nr:hypothetical protein [Candidatus Saccharimonadales bacterium]